MIGVDKVSNQEDLKKALAVRKAVFVDEQKVPLEDEYDQFDETAVHFLATDSDGTPYGAARWRTIDGGVKLERFAVVKNSRGKGIGSMLLESVLEDIKIHAKNEPTRLYLHAQLGALPLYEKFGFAKEGDIFEECGIKHYKMSRTL